MNFSLQYPCIVKWKGDKKKTNHLGDVVLIAIKFSEQLLQESVILNLGEFDTLKWCIILNNIALRFADPLEMVALSISLMIREKLPLVMQNRLVSQDFALQRLSETKEAS